MTTLATVPQLEARLERKLTGSEKTRASALLEDASAAVRSLTGRKFTSTTGDVVRLRVRGRMVRLPQRPVVGVTAVKDIDGNELDFTYYAGEKFMLSAVPLGGYVDVTYDHGYEQVPDVVVGVVCQMAGRALGVKPDDTGYSNEAIEGYSYGVGTAAAAGAVGMLEDDKKALKPFRRAGGMAALGG